MGDSKLLVNSFLTQGLPLILLTLGATYFISEVRRPLFRAEVNQKSRVSPHSKHNVKPLDEEMRQTLEDLEDKFLDHYEIR